MPDRLRIAMSLPPKALWQNSRTHWSVHSRMTRQYRHDAWVLSLGSGSVPDRPWDFASAKLVFYWPDRIKRDIRNAEAAMKPAYDGIVDAGVLVDDNSHRLKHQETVFEYDKTNPRVEITITKVEQ